MNASENISTQEIYRRLLNEGFTGSVTIDALMAPLTYYKIGGPADLLIEPENTADVIIAKKISCETGYPLTIIGGGSNLLVNDKGIRGIVLRLGKGFSFIETDEEKMNIRCGASAILGHVLRDGIRIGMNRIECVAGIPGWVGGAIFMNAGSFEIYMSDIADSVNILTNDDKEMILNKSECYFGYRTSRFQKSGEIILSCVLHSERGDKEEIAREVERRMERRRNTQPIDSPSCGCVFKNPEGEKSAAQMIDDAGLKGTRIGGAAISERHANFIINLGDAVSDDILKLMSLVRKNIYQKFGVVLKPEVQVLGYSNPLEVILDEWEERSCKNGPNE